MTTGIILLAAVLNAGSVPTPEQRLLVDTDMLTDCDDVAALEPRGKTAAAMCRELGEGFAAFDAAAERIPDGGAALRGVRFESDRLR